jgi:uncharacterized protein YdaU (DUF1376 family)
MARDPAFLFYPGDWLGGTMTFSRSHKGAYMDCLMAQFNSGHLSDDDVKFILGQDYDLMWESKLKAKFRIDAEGKFFNQKLEDEILKRRRFVKSRHDNLNTDRKDDTHMDNHISNHMQGHMENENENENENTNTNHALNTNTNTRKTLLQKETTPLINIPFSDFWNLYDHKVGGRDKTEKKWNRLKAQERVAIMAHVPDFVRSKPDKQFRPHPATYLNQRRWEDEIISGASPLAPTPAQLYVSKIKPEDNHW